MTKPISHEQDDYEYLLRRIDALTELMTTFTGDTEYDRAMLARCNESMSRLWADAGKRRAA